MLKRFGPSEVSLRTPENLADRIKIKDLASFPCEVRENRSPRLILPIPAWW